MLQIVDYINNRINDFVWGVPAMICIIGVGLYLTFRMRFVQIRKLGTALKLTLGKVFKKGKAKDGSITPFQAVCTALAATIGTGNIAGVAGAIAIGGPGAIFWMWMSAILGMCTKFCEVTLAVHFREKNKKGEYVGGPMYYIKNGLHKRWHWLAFVYAFFGMITAFGIGNTTQVNTITTAVNEALVNFKLIERGNFLSSNIIIGCVVAVVAIVILIGGIKRIGTVTERLVPFMALLYVILALGVIFVNIGSIPRIFVSIFEGAFNPLAVTGGVVGSFFLSVKKGVSRGIFSNEAGLGTGAIAHAAAHTDSPVKQGYFGIFEVFVDTIVICTLTALVILCSGVNIDFGNPAGAELTITSLTSTYGNWISIFTAISLCCFAFSTLVGWGLYGARCVEFLFSNKAVRPFTIIYSLMSILASVLNLGFVWTIADTFNGLMSIPNLIALFLLGGSLVKIVKDHYTKNKKE